MTDLKDVPTAEVIKSGEMETENLFYIILMKKVITLENIINSQVGKPVQSDMICKGIK